MSIDLSKINYSNPNHVFVTTGKKIEDNVIADNQPANGIIDVDDLIKEYGEIFGEISLSEYLSLEDKNSKKGKGLKLFGDIKSSLKLILNTSNLDIDFITNESLTNEVRKELEDGFYASAKTISGETIDSNCLEGYRAYSFYLEKIILLLKKLNDAINQGQDAIEQISNLKLDDVSADQTIEEYVNSKVHELSAELYLADQAIADVKAEFESCLKYNVDTKSWDKSSYEVTGTQFLKPSSLDNLRGIKIAVSNANDPSDTHKIACFSELNLLDRLRYIRCYYELILNGQDSDYQVFPDDSETGYPCVPDIKSTTDTKATESMGGFELFYVGYLVDRDGSIDAYSSCLEAKSKAITDNISLQSEHIEAYNQYLAFINRATQLLNESQRGGAAAIAHGAHLGLTYFCGGTMRDLLEVDGVNYIVLSYTTSEGSQDEENTDFNYGFNHRYLLVRADEKGLKALYNTDEDGKGKDPNGNVNGNVNRLEIITAKDLVDIFNKSCQLDCPYTPASGFSGTTFYKRAYNTSGTCPTIVSSSEENREILIWDMTPELLSLDKDTYAESMYNKKYDDLEQDKKTNVNNVIANAKAFNDNLDDQAQKMFKKDYKDLNTDERNSFRIKNAEKYLPKRLTAQTIKPSSVAEYDKYDQYKEGSDGWGYIEKKEGDETTGWEESADEANRVINSWTSAFSNKSDYINTAIETINTDITALRTKMDTIDSLCSTLRNRSFETKKTLISNLRS